MKAQSEPGRTLDFVAAEGFGERHGRFVLIDPDGNGRAFMELSGDPDDPQVRPADAYAQILSAIEPGSRLRFLLIAWPGPEPRRAFLRAAQAWPKPAAGSGLEALRRGLFEMLQEAPPPFQRRTIFEFVLQTPEDVETCSAAASILEEHGITVRTLTAPEVQELCRWILNPSLDV